jgi:hypothetical protein
MMASTARQPPRSLGLLCAVILLKILRERPAAAVGVPMLGVLPFSKPLPMVYDP